MTKEYSLLGCTSKVSRATELIDQFDAELRQSFDDGLWGVRTETNPETKASEMFIKFPPEYQRRYGVLIGEILHDLRSPLDHLVWYLVKQNGFEPTSSNYFPVAYSPADFKAQVTSKLAGVSKGDVEVIQKFQPFLRSDADQLHELTILSRLSNQDKHRVLHVALMSLESFEMMITGKGGSSIELRVPPGKTMALRMPPMPRQGVYEDGEQMLGTTQTNPDMEITSRYQFSVSIDVDGSGKDKPVIPILRQLATWTNSVIEKFAQKFEQIETEPID